MVAKAKKSRKLLYVSVLAYFIFMLVMFPLNIAYKIIQPKNLPIQVVAVSGTLWDGEVVFKHAISGQGQFQWQLSPLAMLWGQANSLFVLKSTQFEGKGELSVGLNGDIALNHVSAYVNADVINRPLKGQRVTIKGDVELMDTSIVFNWYDKKTSAANGQLIWQGGDVKYPKGRKSKNAKLPMLVAKLSATKGELLVQVNTAEGEGVAKANLKTDGWASVAIQKRMIDLLGEPWSKKAKADSTVFELSEKVF